ncbi:MAG: PAS domain S-box protein [Desulfobulbus sp.]|nr:PAS domain S-box protein [Desulfobulbus sp.]
MNKATLLIVEDDGILAAHLKTTIDRLGFATIGPVATGEEAVSIVRQQPIDLILMDIELAGEQNGIEAATEITGFADIPILFLTGFSQEPLLEQAKQVAPYGYLIKPVAEPELAAAVTMALQRHKLNRELQDSREALAQSEARYRHLFAHSPLGIFRCSLDGTLLEANPSLINILGYEPAPADAFAPIALGKHLDLAHQPYLELLGILHKEGTVRNHELQVKKQGGEKAWIAVSATLTPIGGLPPGQSTTVIDGFAVDITEKKRLEQVQNFLAQASSGYGDAPFFHVLIRYLAEHLNMDFVCVSELQDEARSARIVAAWRDGQIIDNFTYCLEETPCTDTVDKGICCYPDKVAKRYPNASLLKEFEAESYLGRTLFDHTSKPMGLLVAIGRAPLTNQRLAEALLQMVAGRAAGELERQLAEEKLQTTLKRFQIMLASLYPGVLVVSDAGRVEFVNPAFRTLFDLNEPLEQLIGCLPEELLQKMIRVVPDPPSFLTRVREILATRQPFRDEEIAINQDRTYQREFVPIVIDGRQYGRLWLYDDITKRRKAEEALRESEQRLRNYFELGLIGMAMLSIDRHFLHFNNRLSEIFGYSKEELAQLTWNDLTHTDDLPKDLSRFARIQRLETDIFHAEKRFLKKDGSIVHAEVILRCVRTQDGTIDHYVAMIQDITTRKLTEEKAKALRAQLLQSQKLEAIGTLAGGIAHDFNNILAAVIGYTDMAKELTEQGSPLAKDLDQVLKAGHRAKDLVRQILVFSRQSETEPINLLPVNIVKEVVKLLRPTLPSTIAIEQKISPKAGPIRIDPTQLHQILMNLCTNAYHAMEESGGILTIDLQNITFTAQDLPNTLHAKPGAYVELVVGDTGAGIPASIRDRIFDPFFTTKELGKGTGMGLSIVHGIVTGYNGFISLKSTPGEGTEFRIYLPLATQTVENEEQENEPVPQGSEHILFVDDEEVLAEMVQSMLERLGYRVTVRTSSLEALTTFRNHPDLFDLVITDQTMPGLTGLDLARRILTLRPDMPIILCTGYSTLISEEEAKAHGVRAFALKPLTKKDLAILIRKVLNVE